MKRIRTLSVAALAILLTFSALPLSASANSALTQWRGSSGTGTMSLDKDCPITVEKELLTFDIVAFPKHYFESSQYDPSESSAASGISGASVTAEYTFYNPEDYDVSARLVFPFGRVPDYADLDFFQKETAEKYGITVDGEPIEAKLRHMFYREPYHFEPETELAKLHGGYAAHIFYRPDLTVTLCEYTVSELDESNHAATAAFEWSGDAGRTKVLLKEMCGGDFAERRARVDIWAKNESTLSVYFFGEKPDGDIAWKLYTDGSCKTVADGRVTLQSTEFMTFKDYIMTDYDKASGISETDWYNAQLENLCEEASHGVIQPYTMNLECSLMRWYEYELNVSAGQRVTNTVSAPLLPDVDMRYDSGIYTYNYLLSPAKTWADFGELTIVINTPYYMQEGGMSGFEKTDGGYILTRNGLPDGEMSFLLSEAEKPALMKKSITDIVPKEILIAGSVSVGAMLVCGGVIILVFVIIRRRRKKPRT